MTSIDRTLRTHRGRPQDRRRKVGTSALLLLALFAGLIGFAPGAFAHHAYLQDNAAGVCDPATGDIDVSFEVRSWGAVSSGERVLNSSIGIQYRVGATSTFPAITSPISGFSGDVTTGAFTDNNSGGTPSLTGSFTLDASAGGQYLQLRAYPQGSWTNAAGTSTQASNPEGDDSFTVTVVPLPTGCTPPATPSATAAAACQANAIAVGFTGVGSATTADISKNGAVIASGHPVPVGPSSFNVPLVAADENTTVTIGLDYAATSATDQSLRVPIDCKTPAAPSADVNWECGADATVTLGNAGQETLAATIHKNGVPVLIDVAVPPGGTTSVVDIDAADENTAVTITVTFSDAGGATDVTEVLTIDCEQPSLVSAVLDCAEGGLVVLLTNDGESDTVVLVDGVEVPVPAGTDVEHAVKVTIPVAENAAYDVSVEGDGIQERFTGTADCLQPQPSVDDDIVCATEGLQLELRNAGDDTATFVITSPALSDGADEVMVAAGASATILIPLGEGASTDVLVTSDDEVLLDRTLTRDCATVGGETVIPGSSPLRSGGVSVLAGQSSLARTGADTAGLLGLAGALLLAGVVLTVGARRRQEAPVS